MNQPKAFVTRELYHTVITTRIRVKKIATHLSDNVRLCCIVDGHYCCVVDLELIFSFLQGCGMYCM